MANLRDRARPPVIAPGVAELALAALALFVLYGSFGAVTVAGPRPTALPGISLPDIVQNVLLYIPFGTLGVWALRPRTAYEYVRLIAVAFVYSAAMELLQTLSASRIASPLDVIANVLGTAIGAAAAGRAERTLAITLERVRVTGLPAAPARYVLAAVAAAIVFAAWYPFDITLDVSTLSERTRAVRRDPWLRPEMAELWGQGIRFFVLGAITTLCLPGLARRAAPVAAVAGIAAAVVIDAGQLAMGSKPIGGAALLSQAAGSGLGAVAVFGAELARRTWYAAA